MTRGYCFWLRPQDPNFPKAKDRIRQLPVHHLAGVPHFLAASVEAGAAVAPRFPHEAEWAHELNPSETVGLAGLEVVGPTHQFTHVRCPRATLNRRCPDDDQFPCHTDSLVIACHGLCPGSGTPHGATSSSYGVFFGLVGRANDHNVAGRITMPNSPNCHTTQRAELWAAITALEEGFQFVSFGGQWQCDATSCGAIFGYQLVGYRGCKTKHLVIKSDSAYVVNSVTEHLDKWIEKGWKTAKKGPVKNKDLWMMLAEKIKAVEAAGAAVQFWLVGKEANEHAVRLAWTALKED